MLSRRLLLIVGLCGQVELQSQQPAALSIGQSFTRIGTLDGSEPYVFGEISDGVVTPSGVVIVDSRLNAVRMYDGRGRYIATIGHPGSGPGEFVHPIAAAIDGPHLLILDDAAARISVFDVRTGDAGYVRSISLPFSAFDICLMGDQVAVLGFYRGTTIHLFTLTDGKLTRSFGPTWGPDHPLLNRSLAQGFLACSTESNLIVAVSALVPEVRAFRTDGSIAWSRRIEHFVPIVLTPDASNRITYSEPSQGFNHVVLSAVPLEGGRSLIQYGKTTADSRGPYDTADVQSVIYDRVGSALVAQQNLPRIVSVTYGIAVSTAEDPFPLAEVHHISRAGRTP